MLNFHNDKLLGGLLLILLAVLFIGGFERLGNQHPELAVDWKMFWQATQGFQINYIPWIFNPPWSLALLWPISSLPLYQSWGLLVFVTLLVVVALMPRQARLWQELFWLLLALSSYTFVRQIFEGNIEILVLMGFLAPATRSRV